MKRDKPVALGVKFINLSVVFLVLGLVVMLAVSGGVLFASPLFIVAFILAIVGTVKGLVWQGIISMLMVLTIPPFVFFVALAMQMSEDPSFPDSSLNSEILSNIQFEDVQGYKDGDYMYVEGTVRNMSEITVDFVKVHVEWQDENGRALDTGYTYAVSGEGLRPGGAKKFEIMSRGDDRMEKFRYWATAN